MSSDQVDVQPSPPLIATLKRRLRDPSILPRFEHDHRLGAESCLISPHWILTRANEYDASEKTVVTTSATQGQLENPAITERCQSDETFNAIPLRNYIDLRIQQNKLFADERFKRYTSMAQSWKDNRANTNNKSHKQWDIMKSCVKEGLAAYPQHEGLLDAQQYMNEFHSRNQMSDDHHLLQSINISHQASATSNKGEALLTHLELKHQLPTKGAEKRAQAAMKDALLERTFLSQHTADGSTNGPTEYTLLPEQDDEQKVNDSSDFSSSEQSQRHRRKEKDKHGSSDSNSSDNRRYKKREKKHRKEKKRKHRYEKKRRKHKKRSCSV